MDLNFVCKIFLIDAYDVGKSDKKNYKQVSINGSRCYPKHMESTITYILQIKLKLLLIGFKLRGQLVSLMVKCKQPLKEG